MANRIKGIPEELLKISGTKARKLGLYDKIAAAHESSGRCVFCNLKEKYIITEYQDWALTINLFPRSTGDLLVIPKRHIESYGELTEKDHIAMGYLNQLAIKLLEKALSITAIYCLLREGKKTDKTVRHLHGQVMNYWDGLLTWHPMEEIQPPIDIAQKLKKAIKKL